MSKVYIQKEWFTELLDPIIEEELNSIFKDLLNDKASNISSISYKIFKKLEKRVRKILREFYLCCLEKEINSQS